jgi:hypothetical protein
MRWWAANHDSEYQWRFRNDQLSITVSPDGTNGWANATGSGSTTATFTPPSTEPAQLIKNY